MHTIAFNLIYQSDVMYAEYTSTLSIHPAEPVYTPFIQSKFNSDRVVVVKHTHTQNNKKNVKQKNSIVKCSSSTQYNFYCDFLIFLHTT